MDLFTCFDCKTHDGGQLVSPLTTTEKSCPKCGGMNGNVHSPEQFMELLGAGVIFSYDAKGRRKAFEKKNSE